MRECIRCKTEMVEGLNIRDSGQFTSIIINTPGVFGKNLGKVKAAVCPNCGEISLYLEDTDKLNDYIRQN